MNFSFHAVTQCGIHNLMTGDRAFALEGGADDEGFKVGTITLNLEMFTCQVGSDVLTDLVGGRQHDNQFRSL